MNGKRLDHGEHCLLEAGDLIEFGAWQCRCQDAGRTHEVTMFVDQPERDTHISTVARSDLAGSAQVRLDALMTVSREFNAAESPTDVAIAMVEAVRVTTGCRRVVVVRMMSEAAFETLASSTNETPRLSRSLVDAASLNGCLVEHRCQGGIVDQAHSIAELDIQTAICVPILVNHAADAFLYLDTRANESTLPKKIATFCQAVAQLGGLAFERVMNAELADRHAQLESDLDAARRAQEFLMPLTSGTIGRASYCYQSLPGRVVAGDLFDIFRLAPSRTALFLGDVAGKGVGAAVLMAAVQSQLRTLLLSSIPLNKAVRIVNDDLQKRSEANKFVTLVAAIINTDSHTVEMVDAGHGYGAIVVPGQAPMPIEVSGGPPLGIVDSSEYESSTLEFPPGSHLIFFSDGVVEQVNSAGVQYGYDAALTSLNCSNTPEAIAASLLEDVRSHAAGGLDDDLTVAVIRFDISKGEQP